MSLKEYLKKDIDFSHFDEKEKDCIAYATKVALSLFEKLRDERIVPLEAKVKALDIRTSTRIKEFEGSLKEFQEIVKKTKYLVVDFWDLRCIPCFFLEPIWEKVSKKFKDINFIRVNVGEKLDIGQAYHIVELPTQILFKNGKVYERLAGVPVEEAETIMMDLLDGLTIPKEKFDKALKRAELIAKAKGWELNPDKFIRNMIIRGLIRNEEKYGFPLCPCKIPVENGKIIKENICPCRRYKNYPGSDELLKQGKPCYCGLFVPKGYKGKVSILEKAKHLRESGNI